MLKAYFEGSVAGKEKFQKYYIKIIEELKKLDCSVTENISKVTIEEFSNRTVKESKDMYKKILQDIRDSDIYVCDMTYASPGIAMEIQDAIYRYHKPTLVLRHKIETQGILSPPFLGNPSELLTIREYDDDSLEGILRDFVQKAKDQIPSSRFTVRMTEELDDYVEYLTILWKESSKNKVVLKLISEKMHGDELYERFVKERLKLI